MLITSSAFLPLETKDVSEAVHKVLDLLCSKVSILDDVKISLNLTAMSFPDILVLLAKALPNKAEGFGIDMSTPAGQFLQAHASGQLSKPSVCACDVTDYLSVSDTLALIKSFFQTTPRAIRSTSFSIIFQNLDWRGADGVGSGKLFFSDLKAFHRKHRFSLSAIYCCRGKNSKDESVKTLFKKIAGETSIPFDKGTITEEIEPEILAKSDPKQIFAACICFEEAFEQAGRKVRSRNFQWQELPGLASEHESFNRRMETVRSGKKGRVNFPGLVRRFMKEYFPSLKPWEDSGERIFFSKPISSDLEMVLGFDRINFWGLGKTFTLILGVKITEGPLAGSKWNHNFFRLFQQQTFPPCWTYVTKVELARTFEGINNFLKNILPVFEDELTRYLCPIPRKLPGSIQDRGAISAKQVLGEALNAAKAWSDDVALYRVGSGGLLSLPDSGMGPVIDSSGFLRPHGCWYYCFYSPSKKRELFIQVPSLGTLRCDEWYCHQPFGSAGEHVFSAPVDRWIDSDRAMTIAEENGGGAAREDALENWDIIAKLEIPPNRLPGVEELLKEYGNNWPDLNTIMDFLQSKNLKDQASQLRWTIQYVIQKTKNRFEHLEISFNAIDGGNINVSCV